MAVATQTWPFLSNSESWAATDGAETTSQWASGDGSPANGSLEARISGRNKDNQDNYWEITGTWESLFSIAADSTVTAIETGDVSGPYLWACTEWNVGSAGNCNSGPLVILDSSDTLIATVANVESGVSGTTSWAYAGNTGQQAIGASYQASDTSIKIRVYTDLVNANDGAAAVTIRQDTVSLKITHEAAGGLSIPIAMHHYKQLNGSN